MSSFTSSGKYQPRPQLSHRRPHPVQPSGPDVVSGSSVGGGTSHVPRPDVVSGSSGGGGTSHVPRPDVVSGSRGGGTTHVPRPDVVSGRGGGGTTHVPRHDVVSGSGGGGTTHVPRHDVVSGSGGGGTTDVVHLDVGSGGGGGGGADVRHHHVGGGGGGGGANDILHHDFGGGLTGVLHLDVGGATDVVHHDDVGSGGDGGTVTNHHCPAIFHPSLDMIRGIVLEIIARIVNLIGLDDAGGKQIVYVVACIVGVCVDPFFLYIPFLSHTKMCLGMNRELWKVAVALRSAVDLTALILSRQLRGCMSSIKLILLMCVNCLAIAPIPQILLSEKFILKTLGGYTFWNWILFCQYGERLVLIFLSCEQLTTRVLESNFPLFWFLVPVYILFYSIVSHVIGASWYYLSIKRQLSCWNDACKIITGCIFLCDGTTPSTLNSTIVKEYCPINPLNTTVFDYGIYLDAIQSRVVEDQGLLEKFLHCFHWGLKNLSSFASNLYVSTNNGETLFAILVTVAGMFLAIYAFEKIRLGLSAAQRVGNRAGERELANLVNRFTD